MRSPSWSRPHRGAVFHEMRRRARCTAACVPQGALMSEADAKEEVDIALAQAVTKRPKQADVLIEIGRTAKLFRTPAPDRDAYADIVIDGHRETWRVRSKGFRGWLRHQYFQRIQAGCNSEAMQVAIETLVSFAQFDKD